MAKVVETRVILELCEYVFAVFAAENEELGPWAFGLGVFSLDEVPPLVCNGCGGKCDGVGERLRV